MTIKRFGVAALLLSAMALTTTGCGMMESSEEHGVKMTGEEHRKKFPEGHEKGKGTNCYYDRYNDTFLCKYK
ncbi:MAG: hypothetical protein ABFS09_10495 [Thermodesulfobacteriota bacterium]